MKICVTGAAGFIGGFVVQELLTAGHHVVGLDNFSKYGRVARGHDAHDRYRFVEGDAKDVALLKTLLADCEIVVAGAARIGGIGYFHAYAYDLLAENERITAATFDAALWAHRERRLRKIVVLSSSMVYEATTTFPTPEGAQLTSPPPRSTYGFQKLACEYFARGAWEQYGLPYTIARPFNCVGIGEVRPGSNGQPPAGTLAAALSHVLPDLTLKALRGEDPLHILGRGNQVRHYTYGGDLARGIRLCVEHPGAMNEDFNLATTAGTTVLQLAQMVWTRVNPGKQFRYACDKPFPFDVQLRVPDVSKARSVLGFEATTSLDAVLDEVVPWIAQQVRLGRV